MLITGINFHQISLLTARGLSTAEAPEISEGFTPAGLEHVLAGHGIVERVLSTEQTARLWSWRQKLAACFGTHELQTRCQRINALLEETATTPYISLHDGNPHLHYSSPDADAAAHIQAVTAAGLAYITCSAGPTRLGSCARLACARAYVDTSRNGRRAYCSVRCANNDAVTPSSHQEEPTIRLITPGQCHNTARQAVASRNVPVIA